MSEDKLISIAPLRDAMFEYSRSYSNMQSDYSVTQLIQPPRVVQLQNRHKDYYDSIPFDEDMLSKQLASFKGTAIHSWFERMLWKHINKNPNCGYMMEQRLWDRICDRKISGKFDCYLNGALYDYKTTSVWKRIFGQFDDYEKQLNLYSYMLGLCGIEVSILYIIAWYMDWDKHKRYQKDYPSKEIEQIHLKNIWSPKKQKDYLYNLIERQKSNEKLPDDQLDLCTNEEMWQKPTSYAVSFPGATRAVRVKDTREEAEIYITDTMAKEKKKDKKEAMKDWYVETRGGDRTRCNEYCKCNVFCNQYQEYCAKGGGCDAKKKETEAA